MWTLVRQTGMKQTMSTTVTFDKRHVVIAKILWTESSKMLSKMKLVSYNQRQTFYKWFDKIHQNLLQNYKPATNFALIWQFLSLFQSSSYSNVTPGGAIVVTATGATPFSTPTTVCSGGGPPRPFPSATYGPPPGATIIPPGTVTPTPSSHGPSPTPSSGSGGGGFANHPPGYRRTNKLGRMGPNSRTPLGVTPPTSPAKNSRGKGKFWIFLKYSLSFFTVF